MLEPVLSSTRVFSAFREECGDEELSVLPRHTKVIVTGNNRTKSVLVGLQGVVKKAVGLGGWHWLVLKNGIEVKLQRNALSVLEHPTGDELEDDEEEIDMFSSGSDIIADKEHDFDTGLGFHRMSRPARIRQTKPWISSSLARANRSSSSSYRDVQSILRSRVNFGKLGSSALRRYCRHFHLVSFFFFSPYFSEILLRTIFFFHVGSFFFWCMGSVVSIKIRQGIRCSMPCSSISRHCLG
ncbi:PREDICTED: uncharacterized protein LOC104817899 isoform X1 [Tarenaya hassleriana]|uniref:uncharacterized protein LOC104817899 isoform X1 n=1 Tax=Tarenaya hassleriana TaxID=28532 RepID=UPI00053C91A3|nr:PREDICTED: uncharacterized protein LOC104817899 isoform X1 [Tarenaya hassleriana]XP_010545583.1 PREDICTED: uncharacterized protein LOC104817899 isoform X1 [Tarenaya hassleriana]XP_010545589.1 PREDICTED: uncharacterized protein LOC104817899 isoform X1 [Tarenaya hassleriana]